MIEVVTWGVGGSVRDLGRTGLAHLGRSRGGAVDAAALALANRIVGNPEGAAGFESSGGLTLVAGRPVMVGVTGAPCDLTVVGGPHIGWGSATVLPAGARLRIGRLHGGARVYVAVRGGLVGQAGRIPRSPTPAGQVGVGADPGTAAATEAVPPRPAGQVARVWPGPRRDWFEDAAWAHLVTAEFTVLPASDRVGLRLDGPALVRRTLRELPSEGLIEGAIQVPPDGRPIVMLADHPVTGGYPVIAVVDPADLPVVAQAAAGATLRFRL